MATSESSSAAPGAVAAPRRSRRVVLVLLAVVALCVVACLAGFGAYYTTFAMLKSEEPYWKAYDVVRVDPQVIEALGEPINDITWFPTGEVRPVAERGSAHLGFTVAGPKGQAHVTVEAQRIGGIWGISLLEVRTEQGQVLHPDVGDAAGLNLAPKWNGK